jgi:hypothetical protein
MIKRLTMVAFATLMFVFASSSFADVNVTFQVDMGIQMQLPSGKFDPATDTVVVRGDFQTMAGDTITWGGHMFTLTKSATNDSIYTITIPFPDSSVGKTIQYKFVKLNGADNWEGVDNRTYEITADANQILPLVYFNNKTSLGVTVTVTFQADMTDLLNQGFNPSTDSIEVRGDTSPLNWGPGLLMQPTLEDPTIFSLNVTFSGTPGVDHIQWKFHADPASKFSNTGWDNIPDNRQFVLPAQDSTLDPIKPVIVLGGQSTADDTVYFRVDMTGAKERFHNTTITGLQSVWIGGSVVPLHWPANWLYSDTAASGTLLRLYDDGDAAHGDSLAGDNTWSTILVFPSGSTTPVFYKYGALFPSVDTLNGGVIYLDNEASVGLNHTLNLILEGGTVKVWNKFGDQIATGIVEEKTNKLPSEFTLSQNYPNPFNPTTKISFTLPKGSNVTLKVYNVLGQEVETVFQGFQNAGKYTATFDGANLASGIYFYSLHADNFTMTKKMILMK